MRRYLKKLGEGNESEPQPSGYSIIIAPVRYCKSIPPAAKILYAEITALTHVRGFCWARNSYFQRLYGVDFRTIQRWIQALHEHDFIDIDQFKDTGERHIWVTSMREIEDRRQARLGTAKKSEGTAKMSHPHVKNAVPNNTANKIIVIGT